MIPGFPQFRYEHRPHRRRGGCVIATLLILLVSWGTATESRARQSAEQLDVHARRVMIRGLTWLQNGYPDRAAAVYAEGLKVHPDNAALLAAMAKAQQTLGDLGSARFYLDQAIDRAPGVLSVMEQDLDLALAAGDGDTAWSAVERMISVDTIDSPFILRQLSVLMDQGATRMASDLAARSLDLFPGDADVVGASLTVFLEVGDSDSIVRTAYRLVELRGSFDDQFILARELMRAGRWEETAEVLTPLLRDEPGDEELLAMMADLDARLPSRNLASELGLDLPVSETSTEDGTPPDSLALLRAAWLDEPEEEDRVVDLATYLMRSNQAREAALLVDEHVAEYPRHLRVWTLTIRTWLAAGDLDAAHQRAEDAVLLFPGYAPIVLAQAEVLAASGNHEEAVRVIDELIERLDAGSEYMDQAATLRSQFLQPQ